MNNLPLNHILPGDTLEILPTLPERCVDLVFADPPYNLQLKADLWRPNLTRVDAVDDGWDQFGSFAEYDTFTRAWLSGCRRVMRDTATIWVSGTYHNIFRVGAIMQDLGFWLLNTIAWWKFNATPNFNGTRLKNDVEFVIWAKKSESSRYTFHHHLMKQFNDFAPGKQLGSVWKINATGGAERLRDAAGKKLHSTQKPEELLRRIILASSNPGDVVFDPFMGSGTTAAMAKLLRRRWLGIERDAGYIAAAQKRIDAVEPLPPDHPLIAAVTEPGPPRVAFAQLIEAGYLRAGDTLYLDKPECAAVILADGRVRADAVTGSIHRVGAQLKGTPSCNGWKHWYYQDKNGQMRPIDHLRQQYRANQKDPQP
ncbi:MAG TPA: DNA methyltransferase [Spirillospora sp.]|nr:DNA methyltransferase [Spirillospora sp.]